MKKLLIGLLLASAPASAALYDFEGKVKTPAWKMAMDDVVTGILRIDDTAFETEEQTSFYRGSLSFTANGLAFDCSSVIWYVSPDGRGVANAVSFSPQLSEAASFSLFQTGERSRWGVEITDENGDYQNFYGDVVSFNEQQPLGDTNPVPEPTSFVLLGSALASLLGTRKVLTKYRT